MIVIDASVWVAARARHEDRSRASRIFIRRIIAQGTPIALPSIVPTEVAAAITRPAWGQPQHISQRLRRRAQRASRAIFTLPPITLYVIDGELARHAARMAYTLYLRAADAIYVALADRLDVPLVSWDSDHLTRASARITVYTPDTAP